LWVYGVDVRLDGIDSEEGDGEVRPRAVWDDTAQRFKITSSTEGFQEFRMNPELASVDYGKASRHTKLSYNKAAGWVWETADYTIAPNTGPSGVPTTDAPTLNAAGSSGTSNLAKLGTPIISPGSDFYALSIFPFAVTIEKQETDPADARIFYSIQQNVWQVYESPFPVEPGMSVQAYSSNENPAWEDSDFATATYNNDPEALEIAIHVPQNPIDFVDAGGPVEPGDYTPEDPVDPIDVTLPGGWEIPDIYEDSDQFQFHWTFDGSDPTSSPDRITGINFKLGYKNNNGHGNNFGGYDISNPNWRDKAARDGMTEEEMDVYEIEVGDDENKPNDRISYHISEWDGANLLSFRVVVQSKNSSLVTNSPVLAANIGIRRIDLPEPVITFAGDPQRGETVTIDKYVDFGNMPIGARVYYTTDGTDPGDDGNGNPTSGTLYTGPFDPLLGAGEYDGEAIIIARVYPPQEYANWFNVSTPRDSFYLVPTWEVSGVATGTFFDGGSSSSSIWDSGTGSYFEWSDSFNDGSTGSQAFFDVSNRERFELGQLLYYNGTGFSVGDAGTLDFGIQLDLGTEYAEFDFQLDQFVTLNQGDAWDNADLIAFSDHQSAQSLNLYGTEYHLFVDFGETTEFGTTDFGEFRVLEEHTAIAKLYGTLVSLGSWW